MISRLLTVPSERNSAYWRDCHLPEPIADYVAEFAKGVRASQRRIMQRARRFREFWENRPEEDTNIKRHWSALTRAAVSPEKLQSLFLVMPDKAMRNQFPAVYTTRKVRSADAPVAVIRKEYAELAKHAQALRTFLVDNDFNGLRALLSDAQATGGDALKRASQLQASKGDLPGTLRCLEELFKLVDPAAKFPYGKPDAQDAPQQAYISAIAELNRYLSKPQHAALAYVAQINYPSNPVSSDAIRKVWERNADKNSRK